jgi:hypothetical protein
MGRAFVQAALRAWYHNPTITWITDPNSFVPKPGMPVFLLSCRWFSRERLQVHVSRVN